jgi:opacity protein-like surface antigen
MIKKMLLVITALIFTTQVFADDSNNTDETLQIFRPAKVERETIGSNYVSRYIDQEDHYTEHANDFYIRISGGLESDVSNFIFNNSSIKGTYDTSGVFGVLTLGYGRKFYDNDLYIGMAIDGTMNSASASFPGNIIHPVDGSIAIPRSIGAYLIPGVYVSKTMLIYIKGGIVGAKYDVSLPDVSTINSFHKNISGYRIGGGLDLFITKNFSFNIEYLFSDYSSFTYQRIFNEQMYNNKFEPHSNQISAGLAYHLG